MSNKKFFFTVFFISLGLYLFAYLGGNLKPSRYAEIKIHSNLTAKLSKELLGFELKKNTFYSSDGKKHVDNIYLTGENDNETLDDGEEEFQIAGSGVLGNTAFLIIESTGPNCGMCGNYFSAFFFKKTSSGWKYSWDEKRFLLFGKYANTNNPAVHIYDDDLALFTTQSGSMQDWIEGVTSHTVIGSKGIIGKPIEGHNYYGSGKAVVLEDEYSGPSDEICSGDAIAPEMWKNSFATMCVNIKGNFRYVSQDNVNYIILSYKGIIDAWECQKTTTIHKTLKYKVKSNGIYPAEIKYKDFDLYHYVDEEIEKLCN